MEMFRATILQDAHGIGFMTVNMLMRGREEFCEEVQELVGSDS